jgi:hypothetical protein
MPLTVNSSYQTLDYIAGRDRNQREAVPRPARVRFFVNVTSVGEGETRMKGLSFGALMLEEPTFSWGLIAIDQLPVDSVPLATACVLKWSNNDNGIFTGCDLGFRMMGSMESTLRYKFSLTFEGSTLRSVANTGMLVSPDLDQLNSTAVFK